MERGTDRLENLRRNVECGDFPCQQPGCNRHHVPPPSITNPVTAPDEATRREDPSSPEPESRAIRSRSDTLVGRAAVEWYPHLQRDTLSGVLRAVTFRRLGDEPTSPCAVCRRDLSGGGELAQRAGLDPSTVLGSDRNRDRNTAIERRENVDRFSIFSGGATGCLLRL